MTLRHTGFAFEISNMVGVPLHLATERQWSVLSTVMCMCGCFYSVMKDLCEVWGTVIGCCEAKLVKFGICSSAKLKNRQAKNSTTTKECDQCNQESTNQNPYILILKPSTRIHILTTIYEDSSFTSTAKWYKRPCLFTQIFIHLSRQWLAKEWTIHFGCVRSLRIVFSKHLRRTLRSDTRKAERRL